jgi:hypothetical protein
MKVSYQARPYPSCSSTFRIQLLVFKRKSKSMTTKECKHYLVYEVGMINNFSCISRHFYDKRMGQEIDGEVLGDEYKGYLFKITGGNDKQGFTMKQGVLVNGRVRILMKKSK